MTSAEVSKRLVVLFDAASISSLSLAADADILCLNPDLVVQLTKRGFRCVELNEAEWAPLRRLLKLRAKRFLTVRLEALRVHDRSQVRWHALLTPLYRRLLSRIWLDRRMLRAQLRRAKYSEVVICTRAAPSLTLASDRLRPFHLADALRRRISVSGSTLTLINASAAQRAGSWLLRGLASARSLVSQAILPFGLPRRLLLSHSDYLLLANSIVDARALQSSAPSMVAGATLVNPSGPVGARMRIQLKGVSQFLSLADLATRADHSQAQRDTDAFLTLLDSCSGLTIRALAKLCARDRNRLRAPLRAFAARVRSAETVMRVVRPRFILLTKEDAWEYRVFVQIARHLSVRTVLVQHGLFVDDEIRGPSIVDELWLWDEQSRATLANSWGHLGTTPVVRILGPTPRDIVTGAREPHFAVLYATQPLKLALRLRHVSEILLAFRGLANVVLTVKVHPKEAEWPYVLAVWVLGLRNAKVERDVDALDLIRKTDLVVTVWSSVGQQALLLNKPVICVRCSPKIPLTAYMGKAVVVGRGSELRAALLRAQALPLTDVTQCTTDQSYTSSHATPTNRLS